MFEGRVLISPECIEFIIDWRRHPIRIRFKKSMRKKNKGFQIPKVGYFFYLYSHYVVYPNLMMAKV
jgi:hypothetical protein